jgi:hypothetical protein
MEMGFNKIKLLIHTVKFLRPKQVSYRLFYFSRNFLFKRNYAKKLIKDVKPLVWKNTISKSPSFLGGQKFMFLNIEHNFLNEIDWNYNASGKLWTYNLNYFDFLNQENIKKEDALFLIKNYIKSSNLLKDGFEPYPISLRCINWIKFLSENKIQEYEINQSIYNQYRNLLHNLEYHLLANHLLENGFSLLFGAYYFQDENLYKKAKKIILKELKEQVLDDGGHFELSPMYHQIILDRLLDCISLVSKNNWNNDEEFSDYMMKKGEEMLSWLNEVTFSNGMIPMVNDSSYNIAPSTSDLNYYAKKRRISLKKSTLSKSGYRTFRNENYELFVDVGEVGASYQPGHAHADTFNFVLHVNGKQVFVDTGTSTYEINKQRKIERSTSSHNTVTIDSKNSSQVWSGFRVAKRAKVELIEDTATRLFAIHNGYKALKMNHRRNFIIEKDCIVIEDLINKKLEAKAHFHVHPECNVSIDESKKKIYINNIEISFSNSVFLQQEEYEFVLGFNKTILAKKVTVFFVNKLYTTIKLNNL